MKRDYRNGRLRICFLNDPYTPVMVYCSVRKEFGRGFDCLTATFDCAEGEGDIEGEPLTDAEMFWLAGIRDQAEEWFDKIRGEAGEDVKAELGLIE